MDEKTLELLKKISEAEERLRQDKIDRLSKEAFPPATQVKTSLPIEEQALFSDTTATPQGLSGGRHNTPSTNAFLERFRLEHEPSLNVEELNNALENIPQESSDPRKNRFNKLLK